MRNANVVASYPAFDVYSRNVDADGFVELSDGDTLALKSERSNYTKLFSISNVWSYAIKSGRDPEAAAARARENGHALVWINAKAAVISAQHRAKFNTVAVECGMRVKYIGRKYTIEADWNNNLKLVEL